MEPVGKSTNLSVSSLQMSDLQNFPKPPSWICEPWQTTLAYTPLSGFSGYKASMNTTRIAKKKRHNQLNTFNPWIWSNHFQLPQRASWIRSDQQTLAAFKVFSALRENRFSLSHQPSTLQKLCQPNMHSSSVFSARTASIMLGDYRATNLPWTDPVICKDLSVAVPK